MYFLGIDLGGTVTKAGIYDALGHEICVSEKYGQVLSTAIGFTERNMDELWCSVCDVIQSVLKNANDEVNLLASEIKGIGFSSHGKGLYAIDRFGNPVRNGIISSDTRALSIVQDWRKKGLDQTSYAKSLQQLWPSQPVALLAWLKHYEPHNYEKIDAILMVHDYIRFKLTGEITAEVTNISSSNLYNQATQDYDTTLMALFDLSELKDKTAPIVHSSEQAGTVTASAAKETGLTQGTGVYGGLFDVVAASIASGVSDHRILSAVAGTWSIATTVLDTLSPSSGYPYIWGKYCTQGQYFVHEGSPTSASNLAWMLKQFFRDQDVSQIYARFNDILQQRALDPNDEMSLIFLPYLFGSNQSSDLKAGFYGIRGHHDQSDMMVAMYRGIVYSHLIHQDRILQLNPHIQKIRFTGGPSQSSAWMQMYADAGGLPLEVVDLKQAGCQAAAMSASVGYGTYGNFSEAILAWMSAGFEYLPDAKRHERLREGYGDFLELSELLSHLSESLKVA